MGAPKDYMHLHGTMPQLGALFCCLETHHPRLFRKKKKAKEDEENEDEEVSNAASDLDATYQAQATHFSEKADVFMEGQTQDIMRDYGDCTDTDSARGLRHS
jgi:hypothetical protein